MARKETFDAAGQVHIAPVQEDRSILERVRDVIGDAAAYVAHDVMPDIRVNVVEQGWYGKSLTPHPDISPGTPGGFDQMWRAGVSLSIDIDTDPERAPASPSPTPDLDR